jgi:hypothetical protein
VSDYRRNRVLPETSTHSVGKSFINFSEEEQRLRRSSLSFFPPVFKSVFISSTVAPSPPLRKWPFPSYRQLSPQPCRARLSTMFLSTQFYFYLLFALCFFFSVYVFPYSSWRWHHIPAPLYLRASIPQTASSSSPSQMLHAPVTLLDIVTFSENQSLPTPFRI